MVSLRNKRILMDHLCGRTYAELAALYGLNPSRIGQIVQTAKQRIGWTPAMSKSQAGAALARLDTFPRYHTPEGFYREVEMERRTAVWGPRPGERWPLGEPENVD
jgi:hypothetical protein